MLPDDVLFEISTFLDPIDLLSLSMVCKDSRKLMGQQDWNRRLQKKMAQSVILKLDKCLSPMEKYKFCATFYQTQKNKAEDEWIHTEVAYVSILSYFQTNHYKHIQYLIKDSEKELFVDCKCIPPHISG
jgi:Cdc6-like AAA superfamily ATPase